jgi:hypothetical protein
VRISALAAVWLAAFGAAAEQAVGQPRPVVAISATPARLSLAADRETVVTLRNFGSSRVALDAGAGGLAVDVRGRPRLVPRASRSAASWLVVAPRRLSLAAGASAAVRIRAQVPARAAPGDHTGVVVFGTRAAQQGRIGVRMRVGVRVTVRVPGTIVRRLVVRGLRPRARRGRHRVLDLALENRGNVSEPLARGAVRVVLVRRGRAVERLPCSRRELLPRSHAVFSVTSRVRGAVLARVEVRGRPARTFRLRL